MVDVWREAHAPDPQNAEAREGLAFELSRILDYCFQEWRSGLFGTPKGLATDITELQQLDENGDYAEAIAYWRAILREAEAW